MSFVSHVCVIRQACLSYTADLSNTFLAGIYLFKVNGNTRTTSEIFSKLTIETPKQCHWRHSSFFTINSEQILRIVLVFPLLAFNKKCCLGYSVTWKSYLDRTDSTRDSFAKYFAFKHRLKQSDWVLFLANLL